MKIRFGSLGLGVASGLVILVLFSGASRLIHPAGTRGNFARSGFGQNSSAGLARLSQRLGISQDQLRQELAGGKTIQEIMQENGATFGSGQRTGSGSAQRTGTGASASGGVRLRPGNSQTSSATSSAS